LVDDALAAEVIALEEFGRAVRKGVRVALIASFNRVRMSAAEAAAGCEILFHKPLRGSVLRGWISGVKADAPGARFTGVDAEFGSLSPRRLRLLVAEDNEVNQSVISHQLARLGQQVVVVASNGRDAVDALEHFAVDAVLMDCQMPELDGYEATREIRSREGSGRRVWIIAMTANTMEGDREKCLFSGMDDYVSKPASLRNLMDALERVPVQAKLEGEVPVSREDSSAEIDWKAVAKLRELGGEGGEALLVSLVDQFVNGGQDLLGVIRRSVSSGGLDGVAVAAHTLRGSASNFGGHSLMEACLALELRAVEGDLSGVGKEFDGVEASFLRTKAALLAHCRGDRENK